MLSLARATSRGRHRLGSRLLRLSSSSATPSSIVTSVASSSRSLSITASRRTPTARAYVGPIPARTHTCGSLRIADVGKQVTLAGWLLTGRKVSKKLAFYPLRDEHGLTQLLVKEESNAQLMRQMEEVTLESVVLIKGVVRERGGARNESMLTGDIEVEVESFTLLNAADRDLPLRPSDEHILANEALRARYRYLDLRRPALSDNIRLRSRVTQAARTHLHALDFVEVETPILLRSTPEGAREFLVPTRVASTATQLGGPTFYALQQSPQQPKQLLISSGAVQKYFQIARCFRDEDGRKDRQPEFTQVDLEMAFVSGAPKDAKSQTVGDGCEGKWRMGGEEVREVVEGLLRSMWQAARGEQEAKTLPERFPVLTYREAMSRFGSDKPDLRMGFEIRTVSNALHPSDFEASEPQPDVVELLSYTPSSAEGKLTGKVLEELLRSKDGEASRLECFKGSPHSPNELSSLLLRKSKHVAAYLAASDISAIDVPTETLAEAVRGAVKAGEAEVGGAEVHEKAESCYFFIGRRANPPDGGSTPLGELRLRLAEELRARGLLATPTAPALTWITEFPLFTRVDADKAHLSRGRTWSSTHHPFTAPMFEDVHLLDAAKGTKARDEDLARVRGQHYDLVLDGQEVGGGSVRIHEARLQEKVMREILELTDEEVGRFAHLLHALKCGAPPHGGIALGLDRLMAILCRTSTIRDVIAFPKAASGFDPVFASPARLTEPARDAEEKRALTHKESEEEVALLRLYGLAKAK